MPLAHTCHLTQAPPSPDGPKAVDVGPGDNPTYDGNITQSSMRVNEGPSNGRVNTGTSSVDEVDFENPLYASASADVKSPTSGEQLYASLPPEGNSQHVRGNGHTRTNTGTGSVDEVNFENPLYDSASADVKSPTSGEQPYASLPPEGGSQHVREHGYTRTNTGTSSVNERDFENPLYDSASGGAAEEEDAIPITDYATLEPGSGSYDYMQWQAGSHNVAVSQGIYEAPQ